MDDTRGDSERAAREPWELAIVLAIGLATMVGAVLTFLSLHEESVALDEDRRAQLETAEVEARSIEAGTQVRHELAMVGRYRQMHADADRLEAGSADASEAVRLQDEARLMRLVADASNQATLAFDWLHLKNPGARAEYDDEARLKAILQTKEYLAVGGNQPGRTVAAADRHHARSERYALGVVATIGLLALLAVARISPVRVRPWIAGISAAAGAVVIPLIAFTEWRI